MGRILSLPRRKRKKKRKKNPRRRRRRRRRSNRCSTTTVTPLKVLKLRWTSKNPWKRKRSPSLPAHDVDIPILVDHAGVACVEPFAVEAFEVASVEARIVVEQGRESRRGQGHGEHDIAHPALLDLVAFIVDDAHIESGHRLACAARLDGQ